MTERPMCSSCSIETNKAEWAKYPHMMDMCKMCQSFQDAIYQTIDQHKKLLEETSQGVSKAKKSSKMSSKRSKWS